MNCRISVNRWVFMYMNKTAGIDVASQEALSINKPVYQTCVLLIDADNPEVLTCYNYGVPES